MLAELIDRQAMKAASRRILQDAQVPPKGFWALYFALILAINLVDSLTGAGVLAIFVTVLASLLSMVLQAGLVFYGMAARRGERTEYLTLFDGFSMAGKIVALALLEFLFIFLWSMLFTIPGIVAAYRYRFAICNLCENPELGPLEALNMSKRQTLGYKSQLFGLDLSYLGWTVLALLPQIAYNTVIYYELVQSTLGYVPPVSLPAELAALPLWGWTLVIGLWELVVSLFYRPAFLVTELGYFETAKRTSGVGLGVPQTPPWGQDQGPDGLGGL